MHVSKNLKMTACLLSLITTAHYLSGCTSPHHCYQIQYCVHLAFLTSDRETTIWRTVTHAHTHAHAHGCAQAHRRAHTGTQTPHLRAGREWPGPVLPAAPRRGCSERHKGLGEARLSSYTNTDGRHTPYFFFLTTRPKLFLQFGQ